MKILCSEFVQRIFENVQQIFRVTMHILMPLLSTQTIKSVT